MLELITNHRDSLVCLYTSLDDAAAAASSRESFNQRSWFLTNAHNHNLLFCAWKQEEMMIIYKLFNNCVFSLLLLVALLLLSGSVPSFSVYASARVGGGGTV